MRLIIDCEDSADALVGISAIRSSHRKGYELCIHTFDDGSAWLVRKTKTGYSAHRDDGPTPAKRGICA